jgi:hypothetical protein
MAKRRLRIHFRIPPYKSPRNEWRREIYDAAKAIMASRSVKYLDTDKLEISIILYLPESACNIHDLDNRAKDILDALHGRMGGSKAIRRVERLVPNDRQFAKMSVSKAHPPKQSHGLGHVTVSKVRRGGTPAKSR